MNRHTYLTICWAIAIAFFSPALGSAALVAQYDFNNDVLDSSGNGYTGAVGGTATYGTGLYSGQSFVFNGSTGVTITGANAGALGLANNSFTVNSWVNFTDLSNDKFIVGSDGPANTNQNLHLIVRGQKAHMGFYSNDTPGNQTLNTNQTYNVAYRYDQSTGEQAIFINGRLDAATLGHVPFQSPGANVSIGNGGCCANAAVGSFDHVQIFNTPIRKGQLIDEYQNVSLAGAPAGATGFIRNYLDSNTLDPLYFSVNNTTSQGGPPSVTAVGGTNGHLVLQSRGHLNTTGQFNPSATGVKISGRWTVDNPGDADFFQVLTRSDGVPNTGSFGETTNGVEFFKQTGTNSVSVSARGGQFSVSGVTQTGSLNFAAGSAYDFVITDNGSQVSFTMTEVGNLTNTSTVTANVGLTGGHEDVDFVTFHNREGGPRTAFLENLKISALAPTIGVLDRGFMVKSVQPGGNIGNFAEADAALANNTGVTVQKSVINFYDGGDSNGNYGGDVTPPLTGDNYAIQATANLWVPADAAGTYTFGTNNDDGARLRIDGNAIINDDSGHPPTDFFGTVTLTPGLHTLELTYFEGGFGAALELFYAAGTHTSFNPVVFSLLNIVVPEPSTVALLACAAPMFLRRRKR